MHWLITIIIIAAIVILAYVFRASLDPFISYSISFVMQYFWYIIVGFLLLFIVISFWNYGERKKK